MGINLMQATETDLDEESAIALDLENGEVNSLLNVIRPTLDDLKILRADADAICAAILSMSSSPKSQWVNTLLPLMTRIIKGTSLGSDVFFDVSDFGWVNIVESRYHLIMDEINASISDPSLIPAFQEIQEDQRFLTNDDLWKVIIFRGYGIDVNNIEAAFPELFKTLNYIPDWSTGMISLLSPGKHIPPHVGLYSGVLRYHMGLKVPDNCAIKVNGITREWQEGRSLIFDDSFEHEAWNKSASSRSVLFVDFLRPLPFPLNIMNKFLVFSLIKDASFIKDAKANFHKFDRLIETMKRK